MTLVEKDGWLLVKRGLYWRPNALGYTGLKEEAGVYSDEQSAAYRDHDDEEATIRIRASEADDTAPGCSDETRARYWQKRANEAASTIERLERERDEVRAARDDAATLLGETILALPGKLFGIHPAEAVKALVARAERAEAERDDALLARDTATEAQNDFQRAYLADKKRYEDWAAEITVGLDDLKSRVAAAEAERDALAKALEKTSSSTLALTSLLNPQLLPAGAEQQLEATAEQARRADRTASQALKGDKP